MKIKAFVFVLLVLFSLITPALAVFAESDDATELKEYTYNVTITYRLGPRSTNGWDMIETENFTVTASSVSEAEEKATSQWEGTKGTYWVFVRANAMRQ